MVVITYFLKLGHNNHGLIFTVVTLGLLRAIETVGLLRAVETDCILAVNGLELESSVHGPTITGHR